MADNSRMPGGEPQPGSGAHSAPDSGGALDRVYETLYRSPVRRLREGRVIGGVAAGVARHFGLDPVLVRVGFVVVGMLLGIGLSLYLLAWFLLPDEKGSLALQRAVRDHDTGSIVLGVFAALSLINAPSDRGGMWWTLVSLAVVGGLVFFFVRRGRGGGRPGGPAGAPWQAPASGPAGAGDPVGTAGPGSGAPFGLGNARSHGSPTRGGDTSVFDPVTGRWVPAVQPETASHPGPPGSPGSQAPDAQPGYPYARPAGGLADHDWTRPAAAPAGLSTSASLGGGVAASPPSHSSPPSTAALPAQRPGLGGGVTTLVLLATAVIGVASGWAAQSSGVAAFAAGGAVDAVLVGSAVALAFLSVIVIVVSLRGRRARALALGVLLLLPFAAGLAGIERSAGGTGFSVEVGPR